MAIRVSDVQLRKEYNDFLKSDTGKQWQDDRRKKMGIKSAGDFKDYLYDFYPEVAMR